jgi:hypothetical protein
MQRSRQGATPFQHWCETLLRSRGWTLRELARRLGVSPSTPYQYRVGNMLPAVGMQRRLAELTGTPAGGLARLVRESRGRRLAPLPPAMPSALPAGRRGLRWGRWRTRPLGVQFTMYRTRGVEDAQLEGLYALATARRDSLEATLNDALRIALPLVKRGP